MILITGASKGVGRYLFTRFKEEDSIALLEHTIPQLRAWMRI